MFENTSNNKRISGAFILVGLLVIGGLIMYFGNLSSYFLESYKIYVRFQEASGLIAGADVRLSGAKIGVIGSTPRLEKDVLKGIRVELKIYEKYRVPVGSSFKINQPNIFGDNYIEISPPDQITDFVEDNQEIVGASGSLMDEIQVRADTLAKEVSSAIKAFEKIADKFTITLDNLNKNFLNEKNSQSLSNALTKIEEVADDLKKRSSELKPGLSKVEETMNSADDFFAEATETINGLKPSLQKFAKVADKLEIAADSIANGSNALAENFEKIESEDGLLKALIEDSSLKNDAQQFLKNIKETGILRYKDLSKYKNKPKRKTLFDL